MGATHTPEDTTLWQRQLASQANNHAWSLAESGQRTPEQDEDMLQAAHAAMYFWKLAGDETNRAHAALLVAHVYALLQLPRPARHYLMQVVGHFDGHEPQPWEAALLQAVRANVAAAAQDTDAHRLHHAAATAQVAALADPEERSILEATLNVVPVP